MNQTSDQNLSNYSRPEVINSKKMILWLFIVTIVMLFAAFTSAYIVRKADGEWLLFSLPAVFAYSTGIIMLSSVTMQWAYRLLKKDQVQKAKVFVGLTFLLGFAFLCVQYVGLFDVLVSMNVFLGGESSNPAGSFVYILLGVHAFHLVTGLIYILIVLSMLFKGQITKEKSLQFELCTTYWHFLDLLWIYLFVFLLVNN
ncbi:MAG: cytochrome c oxidase subunit 3 [Cytophagaceae bacterium]|nr:cytochrome c oxidase subunit 3 [Cytophagaceae bacterium]